MRLVPRLAALALAGFAALMGSTLSVAALEVRTLRIPMAGAGPEGLDAILVEPDGAGRHPLAIVSHGSPRSASDRPGMSARGMLGETYAFAQRGFVAVAVLRRGYGTSGGGWAETYGPCDDPDYAKAGLAGAADLRAAITYLARRPDVDATKVLAIGVSAGGFATVALTADPPPGLVAAISFAGGRGSRGPDDVCHDERLVEAMSTFGKTSRVPMLWVYAENDHFFAPDLARRMVKAFDAAGGKARLVMAPPYGDEGHHLFLAPDRTAWTSIVDKFLARITLGRAARESVRLAPPSRLNANGQRDFETYLQAAPHKAFAIGAGGGYAWRTARATREDAQGQALATCRELTHADCGIYAVDDGYADNMELGRKSR